MIKNEKDIELLIDQLKEQYDEIYVTTLGEEDYIYKALSRKEYRKIQRLAKDQEDAFERVCNTAILYPKRDYSSFNVKAYVPSQLAPQILELSGFGSWRKEDLIEVYESQMENNFDEQAEVIIATAFPNITFDEMEDWTKEKLMKYLVRARWQLTTLRGVPLKFGRASELEDLEDDEIGIDIEAEQDPMNSLMEYANELRQQGQDPMFILKNSYQKEHKPYVERPLIGGSNQTDSMVAGTFAWKDGVPEDGRYEIIREHIQKVSRR